MRTKTLIWTFVAFVSFAVVSAGLDSIECFADWGDKYSPAGNYPDGSRFSDGNNSWGMTCHVDPDSTACSAPGTPTGSDYLRCVIKVKHEGDMAYSVVAQTPAGANCQDGDDAGYVFANYSQVAMQGDGGLLHDNLTNYSCVIVRIIDYSQQVQAIDLVEDLKYDAHTPVTSDAAINDSYPLDDQDFVCGYSYFDADSDPEDTGLTEFNWYVNGSHDAAYDNISIITGGDTSVGETWQCHVRAFDDVFITGHEAFNISQQVTISLAANEEEGRVAIEEAVNSSLLDPTIWTDQHVYTRNASNTQTQGLFDKVARNDSQFWAFNYVTSGESATGVIGIKTVINVWEATNMAYNEIVDAIEAFIEGTKN